MGGAGTWLLTLLVAVNPGGNPNGVSISGVSHGICCLSPLKTLLIFLIKWQSELNW